MESSSSREITDHTIQTRVLPFNRENGKRSNQKLIINYIIFNYELKNGKNYIVTLGNYKFKYKDCKMLNHLFSFNGRLITKLPAMKNALIGMN